MIHILRELNANGERVEDDVAEALLVKTSGVVDNDNENTTWVEYRFPDSDVIVHRSCHVTLKKGVEALGVIPHLDPDGWARALIADLVAERARTGQPVELRGTFTAQEREALSRAFASDATIGGSLVEG